MEHVEYVIALIILGARKDQIVTSSSTPLIHVCINLLFWVPNQGITSVWFDNINSSQKKAN